MENRQYDAVVAGAGIWGCTVARRLAEAGRKVLVLEKRAGIGGNCRCEIDAETGIEVHTYGSHIFHTHNKKVWDFVRRFTEFNGYQHKVLASYRGKVYHLPLGLTLVNKFFNVELKPGQLDDFLTSTRKAQLFDAFFRGYTSKQWGKAPEEIDPSIIKRVPVRNNYDTNYFNDYWQGIPAEGYNKLFERLVDHENITVQCSCSMMLVDGEVKVRGEGEQWINQFFRAHSSGLRVYYSGPVDALFDYKFGALPWRSLRFELERLPIADFQGTTVVNYTEASVSYTRIHEFRHYHPEPTWPRPSTLNSQPSTLIMREFPKDWEPGDEPYYPINNAESAALLAKYQAEVSTLNSQPTTLNSQLIIGGRLGGYRYYDMDQAMAAALELNLV